MYIQITTKCNMKCAHCCYSCGKNGKHMPRHVWQQAIYYAAENDGEIIAIGGGEPTLHPDFFEILKWCLEKFDYVWMATNGSQTKTMWKLADILDMEYTEEDPIMVNSDEQFSVALSLDCFHDPINTKIEELWRRRVKVRCSNYEIRDVTKSYNGISAQGRAKKTGSGWGEHCPCANNMILPTGKIKLCGCTKSPIIGDIWSGIESKWEKYIINDEHYSNTNCYFGDRRGE